MATAHQSKQRYLWLLLIYFALVDSLLSLHPCSASIPTSLSSSSASSLSASISPKTSKSKYRLRQVQLIHRHGDRTPITPMKDEDYWYGTLPEKHVLDGIARGTALVRPDEGGGGGAGGHGAAGRGPFGQLTLMGLLQMVRLGEKLREELSHTTTNTESSNDKTDKSSHPGNLKLFTPSKPLHPRRVSVMSTDFPRTIQSVQALLTGLFPDIDDYVSSTDREGDAPIISIDVRNTNSYLIPDPQPRQSPHQLVLEQKLSNRPHLLEREQQLKQVARRITKELEDYLGHGADGISFGIGEEKNATEDGKNLEEIEKTKTKPLAWAQLAEILTCLHSRNRLPPSLTLEDVQTVSNHVAWRWFENLRHPVLAKASMWKFADRILDSMERKVAVECERVECGGDDGKVGELIVRSNVGEEELDMECEEEPMLCIYSAHDSTLIGMLCILQLEQPTQWPEYGSYLKIELIREEIDDHTDSAMATQKVLNHWVRFSLNGEILRSNWMKDENGENAIMVPLEKLKEMIHLEHEMEEELESRGLNLKFRWKKELILENNHAK
ncbi:hypothetical protein ACHAXS_011411 [Conticribra weissflogii]